MAKPGDPLSSSKQPKNWDLGSKMAIKLIFWLFWASEWVPLRLKRLHMDQASHGNALDTQHAYILKRKQIGKKRGTTSVAGHSLYSDQIQMMRKIGMWGPSMLAVNRWRLKNSFDLYVFSCGLQIVHDFHQNRCLAAWTRLIWGHRLLNGLPCRQKHDPWSSTLPVTSPAPFFNIAI